MQKTLRKRLGGFSLIELLTVIAIIGILAAIIIPTVGKVRETAQRTVDSNNLREIGKAAAIYATDNRDTPTKSDSGKSADRQRNRLSAVVRSTRTICRSKLSQHVYLEDR